MKHRPSRQHLFLSRSHAHSTHTLRDLGVSPLFLSSGESARLYICHLQRVLECLIYLFLALCKEPEAYTEDVTWSREERGVRNQSTKAPHPLDPGSLGRR